MKTLTPLQALTAKFASKSQVRPELSCVLTDGVNATATDSFRMVEITNIASAESEPVLINAKAIIAAKIKKGIATLDDETIAVEGVKYPIGSAPEASSYPLIERVWEQAAETKQSVEMKVNGEWLAEILTALSKLDDTGAVTIRVTPGSKPILVTAKGNGHTARAILMPINA